LFLSPQEGFEFAPTLDHDAQKFKETDVR